ncbi:MAG TPA: MFS transporter [Chloroflexi bacterium]|nr:MFS transporter [Chloroflexota bacterium]
MKHKNENDQSAGKDQTQTAKRWKVPFFSVWAGQAASLLGSQLVGFALVWHLTAMTGSAKVLVTAAMMEWLPRVFIGPVAGTIVDRWNRRRVMLGADSLIALATAAMIYLGWAGTIEIWHIYLLMMVRSIGGAFHFPAMTASTALMVPEEQLSRIQGLNQLLQGVMNIAAPPLGALLVEIIPLHGVLAVDIGTALLAITALFLVQIPQPKIDPNAEKSSIWGDLRSGLQYVWGWTGLRKVLGLAVLINAISVPAIILIPLLVTKQFGGGAIQIASMQSAFAVGFLVGGLLLAVWGGFRRKIVTATLAIFGSAIGMLMVGLAPSNALLVAISGIFVAGFMSVLTNGPTFALLQTVVEENMQGRVFSLVISAANAMTPLGLLISGPLAEINGIQTWFLITSVVFLFTGLFILGSADIKNIENRTRNAVRAEAQP